MVSLSLSVDEKTDFGIDSETAKSNSEEKVKLFFEKNCFINDEISITFGVKPKIDDDEPFIEFENALFLTAKNGPKLELVGSYDIQKFFYMIENLETYAGLVSYTFSDLMMSSSGGIYFFYRFANPDKSIGFNTSTIERIKKIRPIIDYHWDKYNRNHIDTFFYVCVSRYGMELIDDMVNIESYEEDKFIKELIFEINLNFSELYRSVAEENKKEKK